PSSSSVEEAERNRALRVPIEPAGVVDQALGPLRVRGGDPRGHVDGQLGLVLDEVPALEELAEDGDVAEERDLRDFLALGVVEQPGEDDGLAVLDGDAGFHVAGAEPGYVESIGADGERPVDVAYFREDLRADVPAAIGRGRDVEQHA